MYKLSIGMEKQIFVKNAVIKRINKMKKTKNMHAIKIAILATTFFLIFFMTSLISSNFLLFFMVIQGTTKKSASKLKIHSKTDINIIKKGSMDIITPINLPI